MTISSLVKRFRESPPLPRAQRSTLFDADGFSGQNSAFWWSEVGGSAFKLISQDTIMYAWGRVSWVKTVACVTEIPYIPHCHTVFIKDGCLLDEEVCELQLCNFCHAMWLLEFMTDPHVKENSISCL